MIVTMAFEPKTPSANLWSNVMFRFSTLLTTASLLTATTLSKGEPTKAANTVFRLGARQLKVSCKDMLLTFDSTPTPKLSFLSFNDYMVIPRSELMNATILRNRSTTKVGWMLTTFI